MRASRTGAGAAVAARAREMVAMMVENCILTELRIGLESGSGVIVVVGSGGAGAWKGDCCGLLEG